MSLKSEVPQRNSSGKVYDPVFLCMVGAIVLAVGTSVALRAMVAGGPTAARGADVDPRLPSLLPGKGAGHPANP